MRECSLGVWVTTREQSLGSSLRYRQQSFLRQVWSSPSRSGWQALGLEAHHTQLLKMWVSGIKLKFSCLQGKLFTDWAIFLAQYFRCIRDNGHCWRKAFEQGDCGLLYFFPWRWLLLHTQSWLHDMVGDCMFIFPFPKQLSQGKMNLCCYSFLPQLLFGPSPFPCLSSDIFGKRRNVVYCLFFLLRFTSSICFNSHYQGTGFFFLVNQKAHTLSSYC